MEQEEKKLPEGLEKAAEESASQYYVDGGCSPFPNTEKAAHKAGFIAGAEWQKAKMMKGAVEGMVCATITGTNAISFLSPLPDELNAGDKVRVIVIKEDK